MAQCSSQRVGIDYDETYSSVMDVITLSYLISLVVFEEQSMQLMDVVTTYLYGDLDTKIYMKGPAGLVIPESMCSQPWNTFSFRLKRSLYGMKQSRWLWYKCLREYFIRMGYVNNELCLCVSIKTTNCGFVIIVVYVVA